MLKDGVNLQGGKNMNDWNEFKIVLAVARAGSLAGAAKDLGHDHSTIFRWLNALEKRKAVQLFDRSSGQYVPTEAGAQLAELDRIWPGPGNQAPEAYAW